MSSTIKSMGLVIGGILFGALLTSQFTSPNNTTQSTEITIQDDAPLYWVAPMDENYKRDKPGKSPMGMDLVPVYKSLDDSATSIQISPDVINNLGVRLGKAELKELHAEIKTVGYVQYDEEQLIHIHPRVEGWIEKLYVKTTGDQVTKGQPLYELYSPALVNAQEEMLIALDRKNQRLIKAAESRLLALQLPNKTINTLKQSKRVQQNITFFAPQDGVVDNLNIREGFYVKPGTTIMSIGNLEQVWIVAEVFERQASQVSIGSSVTMTLDYLSGMQWQGKVDYVYPALDPETRTIKIRLRFNNQDNILKPNMFAEVVIHTQSTDASLVVPKDAVIRTGSLDRVVTSLGDGKFKSVAVTLGRFDTDYTEILSGLEVGDAVVTSAQFLLDSESSKSSDFKRMNSQHRSLETDQ